MAIFEDAISKVLVNEGGYVYDKDDPGGETKFGISKRNYPDLDIKNLTVEDAKSIYKRDFWDRIKGDDIESQQAAFEILDTAVNMGVRTTSKLVQTILNLHPDGIIGEVTLKAINEKYPELFITEFKLARIARYTYLVKKNRKLSKYLFGWIRRVLEG